MIGNVLPRARGPHVQNQNKRNKEHTERSASYTAGA